MKRVILSLGLGIIGLLASAQNGLERIIVEKYYVSNGADSIASADMGGGTLPVGSVTYRIFVDMRPGYNFQMAYGDKNHELRFETTTTFFNNEYSGSSTSGDIPIADLGSNSVMLDSWLSVGLACDGCFGVLKTADNGVNNTINTDGILKNNNPVAGIPLTQQDGIIPAKATDTLPSFNTIGISSKSLAVLGSENATVQGQVFSISGTGGGGSWFAFGGVKGRDTSNTVLIAQLTTNGVFTYKLNIQIGTPDGGTQKYVVDNPIDTTEKVLVSLTGTLQPPSNKPSIVANDTLNNKTYKTGDVIPLVATVSNDGTITQVEFFVDGVSIGVVNSAPYTVNYTGASGTHVITMVATDNNNNQITSTPITVSFTNSGTETAIIGNKPYMVYPSPAKDRVTIECSTLQKGSKANYQLFDIIGNLMFSNPIENDVEYVNISSLSKGVYLLVVTGNSQKTTYKIIKE